MRWYAEGCVYLSPRPAPFYRRSFKIVHIFQPDYQPGGNVLRYKDKTFCEIVQNYFNKKQPKPPALSGKTAPQLRRQKARQGAPGVWLPPRPVRFARTCQRTVFVGLCTRDTYRGRYCSAGMVRKERCGLAFYACFKAANPA